MFSAFTLEYPYFLLLILLFLICERFCRAKVQSYFVPHLQVYSQSKGVRSSLVSTLKWTTIVFACLALSSPVKELNIINKKKEGLDIVLSLDTSGSMRQIGFNREDVDQNRWVVVKDIVQDFILKRTNDNIGLVVFGSSVMTASPLSYDKNAQNKIMEGLDIAIVGEKTALIDSIASSINILKNSSTNGNFPQLILKGITDADHSGHLKPFVYAFQLSSSRKDLLSILFNSAHGIAA